MLRPLPHRGDVVAAGAVALAALVALLQVRFDDTWGKGVHFAYAAAALAFVATLALRSPRFVDAYPFDDTHWTKGMKIMASIVADSMGPKAYAVFAPRLSTKSVAHHVADGRKLRGVTPRRGRRPR